MAEDREREQPGEERHKKEAPQGPSWGNMSDRHWSRARQGENVEAMNSLRQRSHAAGVEEGGAHRNSYCLECHGVIPLEYDSRVPGERDTPSHCPHCGVQLDSRVQGMFNWVEIDQVPPGDARAVLLPLLVVMAVVLAGIGALWLLL